MTTKAKTESLSWSTIAKRAVGRHSVPVRQSDRPTAATGSARGKRVLSLSDAQAKLLVQLMNASVEWLAEDLPDTPSAREWQLVRDAQQLQLAIEEGVRLTAMSVS